jgi:hypothetical protein
MDKEEEQKINKLGLNKLIGKFHANIGIKK